ncbi:zeta toxin family protein [Xenophilus azovorans]|uniref:zeta toxin family protein n=1 Tax=Xenophilus azovorans TaxID=151755 RepID=UPI00069057A9|nr:zeta toxin family protein [Xenophilus azovorans]
MSELPRGKLSPEEHEKIYSVIKAEFLANTEPQRRPVAIVTGGQPGSGKSGLTSEASAELSARGGFVLADADKLRGYHPMYAELQRQDDRTAANLTHADCGAWAGRLQRDAVLGMRNVIIDQTSRDPAALERLANGLHGNGYRVELRVMAVNEAVSEQRVLTRYESQKAVSGAGRFSTKDKHDEAYAGLVKTMEAVDAKRLVDAVRVYDKDLRRIHENQLQGPGKEWAAAPGAAKALQDERSRPLTLQEKRELADNYAALAEMIHRPSRKATPEEKALIDQKHGAAVNAAAAEMFRQRSAKETVEAYPQTAGAYAFLEAVRQQNARLHGEQYRAAVEESLRKQLATSIEKGGYPKVNVREIRQERSSGPEPGQER